ncbi:hypothetical protein [Salinisphaera orenii]|uniref:hypothetical protein n=1 Tax=Salinisphaera orenii TaxID=856731 RepID=UPI000DBE4BE8
MPDQTTRRTAGQLAATVVLLALLAGCGADQTTGPSAARVKADLLARVNKTYQGLMETRHFEIDQRKTLGKDLVKFRVVVAYAPNDKRIEQYKEKYGAGGHNKVFMAKHAGTGQDKLTVRYQQHGKQDWRIGRVRKGFQ